MSRCSGFVPGGGGGGGGGSGGPSALPEQWAQENIQANQAATALSAQVSTNFDNLLMIHGGALVGLRVRFTSAIVAGEAEVVVTINGAPTTLALTCNAGSNPSGGTATEANNVIEYVAGDAIGVTLETDASFEPVGIAVEAWLEVIGDL